jgi:hypothetical protein
MKNRILEVLSKKLEGEREMLILDINIMINEPRVIPEHTNYMHDLERKFKELAEINDKIEAIDFYVKALV